MNKFKKSHILVVVLMSFSAAYGQSVVIDGGNIRVDAASGTKATVTTKSNKNAGAKKTRNETVAAESDTTVTTDGKSSSVASVGTAGKVFVNTDFSGRNMSGANYAGASFTNVEAVGTNFKGTDLSRATLTNVDMSKADLRGANMTGAQLTNVDWEGASLEGAIWVDGRRCGPGSVSHCL